MALAEYLLRLGDNALILGHRLSEWCGHAPALEEDLALANVALDLLGQATLWLDLAGEVEGQGRTADSLAFGRDVRAFRNVLLVEQRNGDFAVTITRHFLFDAWHFPVLQALASSSEARVAEIAAKAAREAEYHVERSRDWIVRLGDGTEESRRRMQKAVETLFPYTGELFETDAVEAELMAAGVVPDPAALRPAWIAQVDATLAEATLTRPEGGWMQSGGRSGRHSEHLGYLLAEMQFLQRAYPGAAW